VTGKNGFYIKDENGYGMQTYQNNTNIKGTEITLTAAESGVLKITNSELTWKGTPLSGGGTVITDGSTVYGNGTSANPITLLSEKGEIDLNANANIYITSKSPDSSTNPTIALQCTEISGSSEVIRSSIEIGTKTPAPANLDSITFKADVESHQTLNGTSIYEMTSTAFTVNKQLLIDSGAGFNFKESESTHEPIKSLATQDNYSSWNENMIPDAAAVKWAVQQGGGGGSSSSIIQTATINGFTTDMIGCWCMNTGVLDTETMTKQALALNVVQELIVQQLSGIIIGENKFITHGVARVKKTNEALSITDILIPSGSADGRCCKAGQADRIVLYGSFLPVAHVMVPATEEETEVLCFIN
jgi:hypothetical protein